MRCERSRTTQFIPTWLSPTTVTYGGRAKIANRPLMRLTGAETIGHRNHRKKPRTRIAGSPRQCATTPRLIPMWRKRSEEHTSELQSLRHLVCRLLLEKKKKKKT